MQIHSVRFITKPTATWVGNLLKIIEEFLSSLDPPAALWRRLLGHLSSLTLLVKGGMLRMRSLQVRLSSSWDFRDELLRIPWDPLCQEDLLWWSWAIQQREGVVLSFPVPDLSFYSDASDVGWGAIVEENQVSGVWTPSQRELSINLREMMAVQKGLLEFSSLLRGKTIALFYDNVTTVAYLRRSGGTRSQVLFLEAREILLWVESMEITLLPQFFQGSSPPMSGDHRPIHDLANSEAPSVLCSSVGTQGSGSRCIPPALGQPPGICLPSHSHHQEGSSRTESLSQLRSLIAPFWPQRDWFSRSTGTSIRHSDSTTQTSRSAATTAFPSVSRKSPFASSDYGVTLKRFASQAGFSETVAGQLALCRRESTRLNYQARWGKFRKWCRDFHHRSSEPTIPKIAEFLTFLFKTKKATVSTIKGYRAMLSSVFKFCLPEISS